MADLLAHCLSPLNIGIKIDPTYPIRNNGLDRTNTLIPDWPYTNRYRLNNNVKTIESGDIVRVGTVYGVVEVDHQDNLADADSSPVVNFGLNVWNIRGLIKTTALGTANNPGTTVWHCAPTASTTQDNFAATKVSGTSVRVYVGQPGTVPANCEARAIGIILDEVSGTIGAGEQIPDEVRVLMGGTAVPYNLVTS